MPTGYTQFIESGKVSELKDFAYLCARAFGSLVNYRDSPLSPKLPDLVYTPSKYYVEQLEQAKEHLKKLETMNLLEAEQTINEIEEKEQNDLEERIQRQDILREKYTKILNQVKEWTPPSKDHEELKKFMTQQLEDTIKWDCPDVSYYFPPKKRKVKTVTAQVWLNQEIKETKERIKSFTKHIEDEKKRFEFQLNWIKTLKQSFGE